MEKGEIIEKSVKMTSVKNQSGTTQYLIRLPKEIEDFLEIGKNDKFQFVIDVKEPKEKSILSFRIIRGEKGGKSKG